MNHRKFGLPLKKQGINFDVQHATREPLREASDLTSGRGCLFIDPVQPNGRPTFTGGRECPVMISFMYPSQPLGY